MPLKPCLVLDLEETLVTVKFQEDGVSAIILQRPGLKEFLSHLSPHFEIVIFTETLTEYSDAILDGIQGNQLIRRRFYSKDCDESSITGLTVKDLTKMERSLNKCVLVDDSIHHAQRQSRNLIRIPKFEGDSQDEELFTLREFLLMHKSCDDFRDITSSYGKFAEKKRNRRNGLKHRVSSLLLKQPRTPMNSFNLEFTSVIN